LVWKLFEDIYRYGSLSWFESVWRKMRGDLAIKCRPFDVEGSLWYKRPMKSQERCFVYLITGRKCSHALQLLTRVANS